MSTPSALPLVDATSDSTELHPAEAQRFAEELKQAARDCGFDRVGIAPAVPPPGHARFVEWLDRGHAGAMRYLPDRRAAYAHPRHVLSVVRSVVMLAVDYRPPEPPRDPAAGDGRVARYAAVDRDYHDVLRARLKRLADWLHARRPGCRTRGTVDTAPLLERDFARLAGLGWFGKNTMLVDRRAGSWFLLAGLLTDVDLPPDAPHETSHCGTCTRCLEACPTAAFPEPGVLDARLCLAYHTIELRDAPVPAEFREPLGDRLFGCDACQEACPWNRKAPAAGSPEFVARPERQTVDAVGILALDDAAFALRFAGTPMERTGRAALARNAALVLGNARDARFVPPLSAALADPSPLVRGAAAWALGQHGTEPARAALRERLAIEPDATVRAEIEQALCVAGEFDQKTLTSCAAPPEPCTK